MNDAASLAAIFEKYKRHTDKGTAHSYLDFYAEKFAPLRDKPICLLELGVAAGGSLAIWRDYFPNARWIIGVDNDPSQLALPELADDFRVVLLDCNICSREFRDFFASYRFDIVIDDASHRLNAQYATIVDFGSKIAPGGFLVVEDVKPASLRTLTAAFPDFAVEDLRGVKGRHDDILFWRHYASGAA